MNGVPISLLGVIIAFLAGVVGGGMLLASIVWAFDWGEEPRVFRWYRMFRYHMSVLVHGR